MSKKVTIYDVATEAGVSLATVSRVINGSSVVKENTRNKVLDAIQRLNFKPNQIARGLATSKSTTIAVVFPQQMFSHIKQMIGGIGDASRLLDYTICLYTTDDIGEGNDTISNVMEKIVQSRADGVILFNNDHIKEEREILISNNVPFVCVGNRYSNDTAGSIFVDCEEISYDLTKSYLEKGITDIVLFLQKTVFVSNKDIIEGVKKAYKENNLEFDDQDIITVSNNYTECFEELNELFNIRHDKMHSVIFTNYDKVAVAAKNVIEDHGLKVGEDVEIVGMMDTTYAEMSRPSLSSYHLPIYDMGAMALRLLTKILNNEEIESYEVKANATFIKRNSTK